MSFTTAQATSIRHYLGYPQVYQYANPRLESAIQTVGGDADAVALVTGLLASIDAVWTAFAAALDNAGVKGLGQGEVELYETAEITNKQKLGRIYCSRLSNVFGVPVANDAFGTAGYSGDGWKANNARPTLTGLA